jgi:hypothetical protein
MCEFVGAGHDPLAVARGRERRLFGELQVEICPRLVEPDYAEGGRRLAELVA